MNKKSVSILGVTGSIGQSTADVILAHPDRFDVGLVSAQDNTQKLARMAVALGAKIAVIGNVAREGALRDLLSGTGIIARGGAAALAECVPENTDITVCAITGMAGLIPLMQAIKNSKAVAIANKEPLVAVGALVLETARAHHCRILPIDSEHNAVFQVFDFDHPEVIARIILTASGGPFRTWSLEDMARATPEQALKHPTWSMGSKISIDSATMMNKALEVIEAHVLFDLPPEKIDVLVHPQSIVHGMVEYVDGSILTQMGASDMRTPIAHALGWPERIKTPGQTLDFSMMKNLTFEEPDPIRFPALSLAKHCIKRGPVSCLVMNAANEVAVDSFLKNKLDFLGIIRIIEGALENVPDVRIDSCAAALELDDDVRKTVCHTINNKVI